MFCGSTSILFGKEEEKLSWNLMGKDLFVFDIYIKGAEKKNNDEKLGYICFKKTRNENS